MMRRSIVISALMFVCSLAASAQSKGEVPSWVNGYFQEVDNSYIEVVSAVGYNEENARNKAAEIIVDRRSLATGRQVNVQVRNGDILVSGSDDLEVKSRVIDEYREYLPSGETRVYLLVQTAKNPTYQLENVNVTERYPFSARVFVPGMAQIHKGSTMKGALFIGGEVLAVGGIVVAECLRASYDSKVNKTHSATARQDYINKASNMQNVRNGFIAGAAAIYLWNVIDGVVAKGKRHVEVGSARLSFAPYASPEAAGIGLCVNF